MAEEHYHTYSKPGGDPLNPSDYRGDLPPISGYEGILLHPKCKFGDYQEDNKLLAEEQKGFRKECRCIDHLFSLTNIVETSRCLGKNIYTSFIDFIAKLSILLTEKRYGTNYTIIST